MDTPPCSWRYCTIPSSTPRHGSGTIFTLRRLIQTPFISMTINSWKERFTSVTICLGWSQEFKLVSSSNTDLQNKRWWCVLIASAELKPWPNNLESSQVWEAPGRLPPDPQWAEAEVQLSAWIKQLWQSNTKPLPNSRKTWDSTSRHSNRKKLKSIWLKRRRDQDRSRLSARWDLLAALTFKLPTGTDTPRQTVSTKNKTELTSEILSTPKTFRQHPSGTDQLRMLSKTAPILPLTSSI